MTTPTETSSPAGATAPPATVLASARSFDATSLPARFLASAQAVASLGPGAAFNALDNDDLLTALDVITAHRRHLELYAAWAAGEIKRRSRYPTATQD